MILAANKTLPVTRIGTSFNRLPTTALKVAWIGTSFNRLPTTALIIARLLVAIKLWFIATKA
jgi:hypothetical protein